MKILVALPNKNYYIWQMLVQINNFKKFDYDNNLIYIIGNVKNSDSNIINKIGNLKTKANFYFYDDTRINPKYASSLRPHLLKKFFYSKKEIVNNEVFFYIDPDVLFTKKINFNDLLKDNFWYISDTKSYINSSYIKSKSIELFNKMCNIVGISSDIVEKNDNNAGGAQYILKNIDYKFWEKIENDSEKLYELMINTSNIYSPEKPIQAWTADMWAILWNGLLLNYNINIHKKLNFSWANEDIKNWKLNSLFHNAGITNEKNLFNKLNYQISPFNKDLSFVDKKYCVYNYVKEIKDTEKNFKDFLF